MNEKAFVIAILYDCQITLENGSLIVTMYGTDLYLTFKPGEQFYNEILQEYYSRNLRKHYELILDTACKMAVFFDIDMEEQKCIRNKEGAFMKLTDDEYKCFKDILGEAIDRGIGLMFNRFDN